MQEEFKEVTITEKVPAPAVTSPVTIQTASETPESKENLQKDKPKITVPLGGAVEPHEEAKKQIG